MPVGDQDKSWAPHFICEQCKKTLEGNMELLKRIRIDVVIYFLEINQLHCQYNIILNYNMNTARMCYTLVMTKNEIHL